MDLSFSRANQAARRVVMPLNPTLPEPEMHMETRDVQAAVGALENELWLIDDDPPHPRDMRVVVAYYEADNFKKMLKMQGHDLICYHDMIAEQLKGLRWRFRVQEPFWLPWSTTTYFSQSVSNRPSPGMSPRTKLGEFIAFQRVST